MRTEGIPHARPEWSISTPKSQLPTPKELGHALASVTTVGDEVRRARAEPVAALVVFAGDVRQRRLAVQPGRRQQPRTPRVVLRQSRGDPLEHPRPREVQTVEVSQLRIAGIRDDPGREPVAAAIAREAGKERLEPLREGA